MSFEDFGIIINQTGTEVRTTCPQCSASRKKASDKCLAVNTEKGVWNCNHCGWSGGLNGKEYKPIPYDQTPTLPEAVIKYFEGRGIPEGILEQENIGFKAEFGKTWITFPYFKNSVCVNIKFRTATKDFRQVKDGKKILYRLDKIGRSTKKTLVVTEGEIDALSCLVAGYEATSIPDGAPTANSKTFQTKFDFLLDTEELFAKFEKVIIAGDTDEPGQRAIAELTRRIGVERCYLVTYPEGCKDANDVLKIHGKEELAMILGKAHPCPIEGIVSPNDLFNQVMSDYEQGIHGGVKTGWNSLDEYYTVRPGEMTIITGIPSSGKSNFIDALCVNLMKNHCWRIGYFSPENWPLERHSESLLEKLVDKAFATSKFGARMSPPEIKEGLDDLDDYIKFIMPKDEFLSIDNILKYARILCLQFGIKGLVIDPWNEVEHDFRGLSETQYISQELTKVRRFARFNGIHIWIVAHPTKLMKNSEGKYDPPTMYDISGGAHWRNKADNGICVYRDFDMGTTEIIIQKIRFREIGKIGSTMLKYKYTGNYQDQNGGYVPASSEGYQPKQGYNG